MPQDELNLFEGDFLVIEKRGHKTADGMKAERFDFGLHAQPVHEMPALGERLAVSATLMIAYKDIGRFFEFPIIP